MTEEANANIQVKLNLSDHWIKDHLGPYAQDPEAKTPFDVHVFPNVLDEKLVASLRDEINASVKLETKDNDLYRFKQSKDLRSEISSASLTPLINGFVGAIHDQLLAKVESFSETELSRDSFDITVSRYDTHNYLLCHNDDIRDDSLKASRAFAFVYYLTSRPWLPQQDGGSLILFNPNEAGEPVIINNRIMPLSNALVIFPTSHTSWHSVEEVLATDDVRLSINGWFHYKQAPSNQPKVVYTTESSPYIFSKPVSLDPRLEEFFAETFNGQYLMSSNCADIRRRFKRISEINLSNFLVREKYEEIAEALKEAVKDESNLETVVPYNKRCYKVLKHETMPQILKDLYHCFKSELFYMYLAKLTGLDLTPPSLKSRDTAESDEEDDEDDDFYGEWGDSDDEDYSDSDDDDDEDDDDDGGDDDDDDHDHEEANGDGEQEENEEEEERVKKAENPGKAEKVKKVGKEEEVDDKIKLVAIQAANLSYPETVEKQTEPASSHGDHADAASSSRIKSSRPKAHFDCETDEETNGETSSAGTGTPSKSISDASSSHADIVISPPKRIEYKPAQCKLGDDKSSQDSQTSAGRKATGKPESASSNSDLPSSQRSTVTDKSSPGSDTLSTPSSSSLDIGDTKEFVEVPAGSIRDDIRLSSTAVASHSGVMAKTAAKREAAQLSGQAAATAQESGGQADGSLKRKAEGPTTSKEVAAQEKKSPRKRTRNNDPIQRSSFRQLDPGSYTVIHDHAFERGEKSALDVILHFNHDFSVDFEAGGFITYIDTSADEDPHNLDCELLTMEPKSNSLSLIYRNDSHTCRFLKYINRAHKGPYQDLYCVYYENPDDLPNGQDSID